MLNKLRKLEVYEAIKRQGNFLGSFSEDQGIMSFLSRIWPLRGMESEDSRYTNAYDDAFQHLVNNDDWDDDRTYLTRFKLIDGEDKYFNKFLEVVVHPETRGSNEEILRYVSAINSVLQADRYGLIISDYYNELPIYKLDEKGKATSKAPKIATNTVAFYNGEENIKRYPCFVLTQKMWDDYGYQTSFYLTYSTTGENSRFVGTVKIMRRNVATTLEALPTSFSDLENDYCSLGQDHSYYTNLQNLFPEQYQSILLALRDSAFFSRIHEAFESDSIFKNSLIRANSAEKIRRTIKAELLGRENDGFKFSYIFKPPYNNGSNSVDGSDGFINLFFDFDDDSNFPKRIIALIGKNGVGKTTLLNGLVNELKKEKSNALVPNNLVFSKYFTVSYSVFDRFMPPEADVAFNYVYCGLKKDPLTLKNQQEQIDEFYASAKEIVRRDLTYEWLQILSTFLSKEHLDIMFPNHEQGAEFAMATFEEEAFGRIANHFSSGESILLNVITKIVSQIRENSLILYDEPETHLHPNAICDIISGLSKLLDKFNSFCIMATHSPLIVREVSPDCVIVLKRDENNLSARTLAVDSFGQNLTVITEEIFGNKSVPKLHFEKIRTLVQANKNFDEIIEFLQVGRIPVNLNTRLLISTLIEDRDEESSLF